MKEEFSFAEAYKGKITDVLDRDADFQITYERVDGAKRVFIIGKDETSEAALITQALGQAVQVTKDGYNIVREVWIADQVVLRR